MTDKDYNKKYYERPDVKEAHAKYMKDYYIKHKAELLKKQSDYYIKHKDKIKKYMKTYMRAYKKKKPNLGKRHQASSSSGKE